MKAILPQEFEFEYATDLKSIVQKAYAYAKRFHDCDVPLKMGNKRGYFRVAYEKDNNSYYSYISLKNDYILLKRTISEVYTILSNEFMSYYNKKGF